MPISDLAGRAMPETLAVTLAGLTAVLLRDTDRLRRAAAGTLLLGLGIASTRFTGVRAPAFAISAGIAVAGLVVLLTEAVGFLRDRRRGWPETAPLILCGTALLGLTGWLFLGAALGGGLLTTIGAAGGLLVAAAIVLRAVRLLPLREPARPRQSVVEAGTHSAAGAWGGVHVVAGVVLLFAPQLHVFLLALTATLIAGMEFERRSIDARRWPLSGILALPTIGLAWYLLAHVAGAQSIALLDLPEAPYSEAFQFGVSLALSLVAWSLLRLWPFHRPSRGPLAPLAGAALCTRLIGPALPIGLTHWQPLLYLLLLVGALHALVTRRATAGPALVAGLAVASGAPPAGGAGLTFAVLAGGVEGLGLLARAGRAPNRTGRLLLRLAGITGAALYLDALTAGLGAQVFYTVAVIGALALALAASAGAAPRNS